MTTDKTQKDNITPCLPVGRFAPSPTGRMHLGNVFAAMMSWLSVRSRGGRWVLRIEDLDPQRSRYEYARQLEDDLAWLGLDWDEGGLDDTSPAGPYVQSRRGDIYEKFLSQLRDTGFTYRCTCTRAEILATQAPHESDGRVIYGGKCRPATMPNHLPDTGRGAVRLYVPDRIIGFDDRVFGHREVNLTGHCGDFVAQRADGAWAYQLAVVVDDALMGVNEVVRGCDLLLSTAQQLYLFDLLGLPAPAYAHVPLLCNAAGQRLSKRDASLSLSELRAKFTPGQILGRLAAAIGLVEPGTEASAAELIPLFDWSKIPAREKIII